MGKSPNGSGSVWKRKDGRYGAKLTHPYHDPETGRTKRKTESTTKPDWGAAHRWLLEKQTDLLGGIVVSVEEPPLGDFLAGWLRDVVEPAVAPNTYLKRRYAVRNHLAPAMGHVKLSELEPRRIHALYSRLAREEGASGSPLSYATRREVHVTLN